MSSEMCGSPPHVPNDRNERSTMAKTKAKKLYCSGLRGRKIEEVRELLPEELDQYGWDTGRGDVPVVLILDDGTGVVPSRDPEGNGPGFLFIEKMKVV